MSKKHFKNYSADDSSEIGGTGYADFQNCVLGVIEIFFSLKQFRVSYG